MKSGENHLVVKGAQFISCVVVEFNLTESSGTGMGKTNFNVRDKLNSVKASRYR